MPGFDWWTSTATGIVGRGIAEGVGNMVDIGGQLFSFGDKAVRDAKRAHAIVTTAKSVAQPLAEGAIAAIKEEIRKTPKTIQEKAEKLVKQVATGVTKVAAPTVKTVVRAAKDAATSFAEEGKKEIDKLTGSLAKEAGREAMKEAIPYIVIAVIAVFIIGRATKG
jgi:gas vesicle protein